jgi:hypothetical protein
MTGAVELRRHLGNQEPLLVMRVKHPAGGPDRHDYSYGVLLEVSGSVFSDYSGWLLFYDCCGDYSGFAGSQFAFAEQEIARQLAAKTIEVHEEVLDKNKFLALMKDRLLSTTKDVMHGAQETRTKLRDIENRHGAATGIILELLAYKMFAGRRACSR